MSRARYGDPNWYGDAAYSETRLLKGVSRRATVIVSAEAAAALGVRKAIPQKPSRRVVSSKTG